MRLVYVLRVYALSALCGKRLQTAQGTLPLSSLMGSQARAWERTEYQNTELMDQTGENCGRGGAIELQWNGVVLLPGCCRSLLSFPPACWLPGLSH